MRNKKKNKLIAYLVEVTMERKADLVCHRDDLISFLSGVLNCKRKEAKWLLKKAGMLKKEESQDESQKEEAVIS